ncbi:MAG: lactate dehydrogenase [Rhodospirillaceae bacterium]|nr:lactate dehydrogenase [Rhodospirillaceae bacterium]MBT6977714.1 lactate dehydrogenase [Rhodospirillaceae bacterium]MBT7665841.1 lactate dehydrogenase [Rhodospirillaceae bacterium]MBT7760537.1 lactate dehydrogenase [Rhodospirillaceae bacterium]
MAPKIVFVTQFPAAADSARDLAPKGFDLIIAEARSAEYTAALAEAEYLVGFVDMLVDDQLYESGPNLRLIQLLSAGYDRADIPAAQRAGVPISNNGGANAVAVSEHAIMLMLAVSRDLISQHANVAGGRWRGNDVPKLYELRDKTLGIVGLGTIGKKTARLAQAFGMNVIYYDIARLNEGEEDALNVRFRLLRELLGQADLVSLHVPLNESTTHLIGAGELADMKPEAIMINTSRGPVIDEVAMYNALTNGTIAAAGLDVYDQEPPPADNPLLALDNVILTAHMAGPTQESNQARVRNAFDNVQRVNRGEAPLWVIPELDD